MCRNRFWIIPLLAVIMGCSGEEARTGALARDAPNAAGLHSPVQVPGAATDSEPASVAVTARVEAVSGAVAWDHYEDGSFTARDAITFAIISPARLADRRITVYVEPEQLPADSALRDVGSRCAFSIDPATLEADEVHWGALEGLRVSAPDPDA